PAQLFAFDEQTSIILDALVALAGLGDQAQGSLHGSCAARHGRGGWGRIRSAPHDHHQKGQPTNTAGKAKNPSQRPAAAKGMHAFPSMKKLRRSPSRTPSPRTMRSKF